MAGNKFFRNLFYLNDVTGTGYWRRILPVVTADCLQGSTGIYNTYAMHPILDPKYYVGVNSVTIQRWINDDQRRLMEQFLLPVTRKTGTTLIYEIDDAMGAEDIPRYNRGWKHFDNPKVQDNIRYMLNACDIVTVTTQHIKEYYNNRFGVPMEKMIAVPNMLSRMWIGDRYDEPRKVEQFKHYKSRPRIGIISSLSHYNIEKQKDENGELVKDDMDLVLDVILQTVDDFQWVIIGYIPEQLQELAEKRRIHAIQMSPISAYPSMIEHLQLQAVVAPLQDNEFNRCKSPIKFLECAASGMPLFASDMLPYSPVMPKEFLFKTQDELKDKLLKLKFSSAGAYQKMIAANWKWLNEPKKDGDFELQSSWMEDNIGVWLSLFTIPNAAKKEQSEVK